MNSACLLPLALADWTLHTDWHQRSLPTSNASRPSHFECWQAGRQGKTFGLRDEADHDRKDAILIVLSIGQDTPYFSFRLCHVFLCVPVQSSEGPP
ncbi:hypothetical protein LY76DRAFT_59338 [Colletotrichum caudatum]|nr:hypothetical protein LY76DRAFT_59338 [Colletotrichum caudatum]